MNKTKVNRSITLKHFIALFILFLILGLGVRYRYLILNAYLSIHPLAETNNPVTFARDLNTFSLEKTYLELRCPDDIFCSSGRIYRISPYYPNKYMEEKQTSEQYPCEDGNINQEGRYTLIDTYWNLFWVEVVKCNSTIDYYGPYKIIK